MGALLGSLSALSIGISDLYNRRVALVANVASVTVSLQLLAAVTSVAAVFVVDSTFLVRDVALGGAAGLGMAAGLAGYYGGIVRSSATIVAPIVGTLAAVIPFLFTVATGARPTGLAWAGAGVALAGLLIITTGGGAMKNVGAGVVWGTMSGCGYGFALSAVVGASSESGAWPAVGQRVVAFVLTVALARLAGMATVPPRGTRLWATLGGVASGLSSVFFLAGAEFDAPATVVTASMFPAFAVLIGWLYYGDAVTRRHVVGLAAAIIGVAGVAGG